MKRKLFIILLSSVCASALLFGLSACETKPGDDGSISQIVEITSVTLDSSAITLKIGESQTLEATVLPENASNKTVTWFSLDPTVAKVENGKITALKKGVTSITAACGLKSANCIVTVTDNPAEEQKPGIAFDKTSFMMYVGDSQKINTTVNIGGDGDKTLTWLSSDEKVATVSGGTVKALKAGMTIIVATCGDYSASCTVTVAPVETTGVSLDKTAVSVYIGDSVEIKATVSPENATNKTVLWSSLDASVARVANGRITGVSAGSTVITALCASTAASFTATCVVTVLDGTVTGLTFDKSEHTIYIGDRFTLTPTITPDYAKDKTVIWKSSDESIATVEDGVVTALSYGEVTVTGKAGEIEAQCVINILDPSPIVKIEVEGEDGAYIDEFALANYKLKIIRQSGGIEHIGLTQEYFSSEDLEKLSTPGEHTITVIYKGLNTQWKITIKNHGFDGAEFKSQTFIYDGTVKSLEVTGVPDGTEIIYENNGKSDLGEYTVTATLSKRYYNTKTLTAKLIIKFGDFGNAELQSQTFLYDGTAKRLEVTGAPDGTEIIYTNNGQIEVGEYTVTATLTKTYFNTKTLTATLKIELRERNVTYVLGYDGVTNGNPAIFNVALGLKLSVPVRANGNDGKSFEGWYTAGNFQNKITEIPAGTDEDITLYAKWEYPYEVDANGALTATQFGKTLTEIIIVSEVNGVKVKAIGNSAFANCDKLEKVVIRDGVTNISYNAFGSCRSLISIAIPESVTSIAWQAFISCENLTEITLPPKITGIYRQTFMYCENLSSINIPDGVRSIDDYAFEGCKSLNGVVLPESVTSIGEYAFCRCESLTEINIPQNVTRIGAYAFYSCSELSSVTIPASVAAIGKCAFAYCNNLKSAIFENTSWNYFTSADAEGIIIPPEYLDDPSQSAELLTGDMSGYEWRRRN